MKDWRRALFWWVFRTMCRGVGLLGRLLYGLEIHGQANLPAAGPLIIVGRRISRVDFFASAAFSRLGEFSGLTSLVAICNNRLLARGGRELGILPTIKGRGLSAASLLAAYNLLQQGGILIIPDEGEVPWDGRLQPLRSGAAWLALRTSAPVVAVVMQGGYDIWPRWASRPHLGGKLRLKIGQPFQLCHTPCARVTDDMLRQANDRLRAALADLSDGYLLPEGEKV